MSSPVFSEGSAKVRNAAHVRNEASARRVELANRSHGYVCPHCTQRFAAVLIEAHVLIAHGRAFVSKQSV